MENLEMYASGSSPDSLITPRRTLPSATSAKPTSRPTNTANLLIEMFIPVWPWDLLEFAGFCDVFASLTASTSTKAMNVSENAGRQKMVLENSRAATKLQAVESPNPSRDNLLGLSRIHSPFSAALQVVLRENHQQGHGD
eukprot:m.126009 g.126009  ORF g.126009 m.126009 type:complete len:140 (-) comp13557_c0_seq7:32-451(-)